MYLLGAMNGSRLRYEGLTKAKNYREAIQIIKAGGYATDVKYVDKICDIIQRYGLDQYDQEAATVGADKVSDPAGDKQELPAADKVKEYVVQAGAFQYEKNAKRQLKLVKSLGEDFKKAFIARVGENYVVQVGVFEVEENALRMARRLEAERIKTYIRER